VVIVCQTHDCEDDICVLPKHGDEKIVPYFREHSVTLKALEPKHIQQFYMHELKSVKANTVKHEHANIHKALEYAVKMDLIPYNVSDRVELPKVEKYVPEYFKESEILDFLEKNEGSQACAAVSDRSLLWYAQRRDHWTHVG